MEIKKKDPLNELDLKKLRQISIKRQIPIKRKAIS